jgi:hypothetical protein
MALKTKAPKLTGTEIRTRRAAAELSVGYGSPEKSLIMGKTTETIMTEVYDQLLVGDLDAAKAEISALRKREAANRLTFHP